MDVNERESGASGNTIPGRRGRIVGPYDFRRQLIQRERRFATTDKGNARPALERIREFSGIAANEDAPAVRRNPDIER